MSLLWLANTKLMMLSSVAPQPMNGATPPAMVSSLLSCTALPATITSECGAAPGSSVTTSMSNGANVARTHATRRFQ